MPLAALIAAYQETSQGKLRATLTLAGRSLVERQARLAAAVGAQPVVILVERVPAELAAAIDRLRSEGVGAILARTVDEAADAVPRGDRLLLVADGLIAETGHFTRIAGAVGPAVLTVPDDGADDRHERIDADSRWAGLALTDGATLRETAAMLQDWDPQSTLLRLILQGGARQLAVRGEADGYLLVADNEQELLRAEQQIVAGAGGPGHGWAGRFLLAPIERAATRLLMPTAVTPEWLYLAAALLTGLAVFLFARGWLWAGGLTLLAASPLDGTAERLADVRLHGRRPPGWWSHVIPVAAAAALLALAWALARTDGWGCLSLGVAAILFQVALKGEIHGREIAGSEWLANRTGMIWLMLPFAVANEWLMGLGALAIYAAGSFFWAQREVHRPTHRAAED